MSQEWIRSDYSPGELTRLCDEAIEMTVQQLDELVAASSSASRKGTEPSPLLSFERITADFGDKTLPLTFLSYVSMDEKLSKEASACEEKREQFNVSIYTRRDLYQLLRAQVPSKPEERRLFDETLEAFEDNGLKLAEDQLKQVKALKQKLASLESKFSTHLNQETSFVDYTAAELDGLPPDFIQSLEKPAAGKYRVPTKTPLVLRVMENAKRPETRRKMLEAYENRVATENMPLFEEALQVRSQLAKLLGYSTWADYRTHRWMAADSKTVLNFLQGLKEKLSLASKNDLKQLLKFKRESEPDAQELKAWDITYYAHGLKKRDYHLDDEKIKEYFPIDTVIQGMFAVYSKLFNVNYVEIKDAKVWAPGVKLYKIEEKKSHQSIGYFYTDFYPRKGKYGHAAAFPLISGRTLPDGSYRSPISSIVANFTPAEGGRPVLLVHEEVEILFHEFGHIMHMELTKAPYASLSGTNVDQDFVEAPSQMLENWVYSPKILAMLSGHYQNPKKKLPPTLARAILKARDFNQGFHYMRQLLFGFFDLSCHTPHSFSDSSQEYQRLYKELIGIDPIQGSHVPASFGHLMAGYDASYYGYLWSEVYAQDMFTRFEKEGLMNPKVGMKYRKLILEQGKMKSSFKILEEFLGRKPNTEAFYRMLKIQ